MAGTKDHCTLGPYGTSAYCQKTCSTCGWNPQVAKARNADIAANGLTRCPDGLSRYIVRKGGQTNGNT